ncbi:GNAT family N-acetyltransferase [Celerinatantimonas yamalensis]|uniref:N-acetyltransferase family protein n=1 Tax=Celerinatantimonas yamalensis TaxID=559956 RepID=A0ABW9G2I1_9GAMM
MHQLQSISYQIRSFQEQDFLALQAIYQQGASEGLATIQPPLTSHKRWQKSIVSGSCIVAECSSNIIGWAAFRLMSSRPIYRGVVEVELYVDENYRRQGVGSALLAQLVTNAKSAGYWTLQSLIFASNEAALLLHHQAGFTAFGTRTSLGKMHNRWLDVVLMECQLHANELS